MQRERHIEQEKASGFRRLADSVIRFIKPKQNNGLILSPEPGEKEMLHDLDKKAGEILGNNERILSGVPPTQQNEPLVVDTSKFNH
jgi:hypothetical protein